MNVALSFGILLCVGSTVSFATPCELNYPPQPGIPAPTVCPQSYPIPNPGLTSSNQIGIWSRDRAPMAWISFFDPGGNWANNPGNLATWWHMPPLSTPGDRSDDFIDEPRDLRGYVVGTGNWSLLPNQVPDQIDELLSRLDHLKSQGFRRIVLKAPGGNVFGRAFARVNAQNDPVTAFGGHDVSVNQWWPMPEWKRQQLSDFHGAFQAWRRANTEVTLELYAGAPLGVDFCSTCANGPVGGVNNFGSQNPRVPVLFTGSIYLDNGTSRADLVPVNGKWLLGCPNQGQVAFDPRQFSHVEAMWKATQPWIANGVKMVWFDGASANSTGTSTSQPYRFGFIEWFYNPFYRGQGIRFGGESLPLINGNPAQLDACALTWAPWKALAQNFFTDPQTLNNWRTGGGFDSFNRATTETHILIDDKNKWNMTKFEQARNRGLVVSLVDTDQTLIEQAKRWYSMGPVRTADFDGNGVVNLDDRDKFLAVWSRIDHQDPNQRPKFVVFATGDIDGNGEFDASQDYMGFFQAWECEMYGGQPCLPQNLIVPLIQDLGAADTDV